METEDMGSVEDSKRHSDLLGIVRNVENPSPEDILLHEKMTGALAYIHSLRKILERSKDWVESFIHVNMKDAVKDTDSQLFILLRGLYPDLDVWKTVDQYRTDMGCGRITDGVVPERQEDI